MYLYVCLFYAVAGPSSKINPPHPFFECKVNLDSIPLCKVEIGEHLGLNWYLNLAALAG